MTQYLQLDLAEPPDMPIQVRTITADQAITVVVREHYLHRACTISHAFGLYQGAWLRGVVTFGTPASRHMQISLCPTNPAITTELNRLWVADDLPRNTESWFVSRALKQLPPLIVASYADPKYGHYGYIYRALNFHYAGWTDMDRKTPRLDYLPADPGAHTRDAFRTGYVTTVRRTPKVRYWITTGNRSERRNLEHICGWPRLDWKTQPPAW